jgi:hypothetical protein
MHSFSLIQVGMHSDASGGGVDRHFWELNRGPSGVSSERIWCETKTEFLTTDFTDYTEFFGVGFLAEHMLGRVRPFNGGRRGRNQICDQARLPCGQLPNVTRVEPVHCPYTSSARAPTQKKICVICEICGLPLLLFFGLASEIYYVFRLSHSGRYA